jgi:hypothetical protein
MKTIITFGDVHGRTNWRKNFDPEYYEKIIFVGDYVDSFDVPNSLMSDNLENIIKLKTQFPDKVILLIGNHDIQYMHLNRMDLRCSGFRPEAAPIFHQIFESNRDLFQLCYHQNINGVDYVWSHAGLTESWFYRSANFELPAADKIDDLNFLLHSNAGVSTLSEVPFSRGGYDRPGPLWADKRDLMRSPLFGITQIVGHTQLNIEDRPFEIVSTGVNNDKLIFIDNASESPYLIEY